MKYTCYACTKDAMHLFYDKQNAFHYLLQMKNEQKEVFIHGFVHDEIIENILRYYSCEYIEILHQTIYYKNHYLTISPYSIETNDITSNILFDYMKKKHRIWCCIDDSNKVTWINTCKVIENCVK